jgi:glycosyltransferase involved in cell wall biosynthesis
VEQQIKGLWNAGFDVEVMIVKRSQEGYGAYRNLSRRVREQAAKLRADLTHSMYGGVMAKGVVCSGHHRPVIVSFCGSDLLGENLPGLVRKLAVVYGVWCSRFAAKRACGVVVKSKNLQDALPARVDGKSVRIIPNGIDLRRFHPMDLRGCQTRLGWSEARFHILFPANAGSPVKRRWLAEAAVREVAALGVPADLHLLQGVKHEDVPIWLNASDCLILTSAHEGSPNIVKEALACDRPVVSVDVGDVAERIAGIEGCSLVKTEPKALASALKMVFQGPRRVQGRARVEELSLEKVAQKLGQFYQEVFKQWQSRRA